VFLRRHVVSRGEKRYVSYRLCRTVREGGAVRQEIVANLGKLSEREAERIGRQLLALAGKAPAESGEAQQGPSYLYGGPLVVRTLMELAQLEPLLRPLGETRRRLDLYRTLTVALCAQLLAPGSELHTRDWQRQLLFTREPYTIPYEHFLRALDVLADCHPALEEGLFARVTHLFNQKVDLVFYDLTSSYFEGAGPVELSHRGYSRDGRPDCSQIVVGLAVTKDGFPFAYRVHPGNTVDVKTMEAITRDFRQRFQIDRCLVVGDSGLLSAETAEQMSALGLRYLMGLRAANNAVAQEAMAATHDTPPDGQIGDVTYWPTQVRDDRATVVLHSPGRHAKTRAIAQRKLDTVRPKLQQLERDVRAGKVRKEATIAERVTRILVQAKATPLVEYEVGPGHFAWCERAAKLDAIEQDGGKYVLQTNELTLQASEAVTVYRQLEVVEDGFRRLKDTLRLRPLYHRSAHRVLGHVGLCVLALFLLRLLEQRLLAAGLCHSAERALASVQELRAVEVTLPHGTVWPLPHVSTLSAAIFRALGLPDPKARFHADLQALGINLPPST
jgi:hypothetical protein